ncbi:neprilysin-1-like isoform X1 [Drosophila takahashii]|uniref:neprilysin-1-like isoform X1 n=1 Tax=Drosophila takahashii TaxID=29030 RepID=UPI003898FD89
MKSLMNLDVDPCDNFYEYACGNAKDESVPFIETQHLLGKMELLLARTDLAESLNVSSELRVAQRFYNACLEADLHPFPAADPHYLQLIRSIGGFPAVDGATWNASNFSWIKMSGHLLDYGAEGLIFEPTPNSYPSDIHMAHLGFGFFGNREDITNSTSLAYQFDEQQMRGYLKTFQLPDDKIAKVTEGVFAFYRDAVAAVQWNTYETWAQSESEFNLFLEKMDVVCKRHPEAAANYLAMKLLFSFDAKLGDYTEQRDFCERTLRNVMPYLFNKLYLAAYLSEETKMGVKDLRKSLRRQLYKTDWLDWENRNEVLLKESQLLAPLTSVQALTDRLIQEIGQLEIVEDSFPATIINLRRLTVHMDQLISSQPKELLNEIQSQRDLLMGFNYFVQFLQPPHYHDYLPFAVKYGGLGKSLGHEIIEYINFQSKGVTEERVKCFLDHYSKYLNQTTDALSQHLFDIATMQLAFAAYQSHKKELLEDPKQQNITEQMPGLNLTPDQLFYVRFAQSPCYTYKSELNSQRAEILGALSSRAAFNCPVEPALRDTAETCRLF